jgi:hypothetical protein
VQADKDRNVDTSRRSASNGARGKRGSAMICTSPAASSVIQAGMDTVDPSGRRTT